MFFRGLEQIEGEYQTRTGCVSFAGGFRNCFLGQPKQNRPYFDALSRVCEAQGPPTAALLAFA